MIDAEKEIARNIECRCGHTHAAPTEKIFISENASLRAAEYVRKILPGGRIALVSGAGVYFASDIRHSLKKAGYDVDEIPLSYGVKADKENLERITAADESVMMYIGAGSGTVNELIKRAAYLKKIPCMQFLSAPSAVSLFLNKVDIKGEGNGLPGDPPRILVADTAARVPPGLAVAGMGSLYLAFGGIFDWEYGRLLGFPGVCKEITAELETEIKEFFCRPFDPSDRAEMRRLTVCVLNTALMLGYLSNELPDSPGKAYSAILREQGFAAEGPLIAAHILNELYYIFLRTSDRELLIPPDRTRYAEALAKLNNLDMYSALVKTSEDHGDYLRAAYARDRYRDKLLKRLAELSLPRPALTSEITGILPDLGYGMSKKMDFDKLMGLLALASELSPSDTLLRHIDKAGILWHYVEAV